MNDVATYAEYFNPEGSITIIGFGSLVSEASARRSFDFINFRWGQVKGWARIFNLASCRLIDIGEVRYSTGEISALSFGRMDNNVVSTVALLDITSDGLKSFLTREAGYYITAVPYSDTLGHTGYALVCAEADDDEIRSIWGSDCRCGEWRGGKIFYNTYSKHHEGTSSTTTGTKTDNKGAESTMPLHPSLILEDSNNSKAKTTTTTSARGDCDSDSDGSGIALLAAVIVIEHRDVEVWSNMDAGKYDSRPHLLPTRQYIYPGPGYTRLCYRAHRKQGMLDEFLDNTYLMDRKTTLREYLNANPLLQDYISDEVIYADRICDSMG